MEYKLLQWYPSLPSNWEVGMLVGQGDRVGTFSDYSPCSGKYTDKRLHYREVLANTKFWEKVVPKEFEILKKQTYNCQGVSNGGTYDVIESVKRLSDGKVFSLGDKVRISKLSHDGSFIISKFYLDCNGEKLLCNGECTGNGHVSIEKIEHSKPLFTTYDSVDIFIGDDYWVYDPTMKQENVIHKVNRASQTHDGMGLNRAYFSTKESAEEYRKSKKVIFITTDGVDMYEGDKYYVPQVEGKYRRLTGRCIDFNAEQKGEDDTKRFAKKENAQIYIKNNIELFSAKEIHELLKKYSRSMVDSSIYLELSRIVREKLKK